ncbi:MAG: hypothetical protein U9N55_06930 [candidate division Zixibacteria bacterium]|nr:hypothetical protein [candidate division Zixibacteria bacterium]
MMSLLFRSVVLVLFLAVSVMGQYSMDFSGGGARAEGMGKAFLGVSNDNTAGSWNPAGLYGLEKPTLSLSWGSFMPRGESRTNYTIDSTSLKVGHSGSFGAVSSINFVAPIRIKGHPFVGSFNYTRNGEFYNAGGYSYEFPIIRKFYLSETQYILDTIIYQSSSEPEAWGGLASVIFSAGTRVYNNITIGVAANIYTGTTVQDTHKYSKTDSLINYFNLQTYKYSYTTQVLDTNKFSGINFTIGGKYSGDKFDIGGIIRTPFSLNKKIGRSIYRISYVNDLPIPDGTDTTYYDDIKIKYDIPWIIGVGVAYRATDKLLLSADGVYRAFGNSKTKVRDSVFLDPGSENEEFYTENDPDWTNVLDLRCGGEYMMQTGIGQVPVRAGFGISPLIYPAYDINDGTLDSTRQKTYSYSLSFGTGIWWEQIHLDCAYTYSSYDYTSDFITPEGIKYNKLNSKNYHFNLMFTGYF